MNPVPVSELEDCSLTEIDWLPQIQSNQPPATISASNVAYSMSKIEVDSTPSGDNRKPRHSYANLIKMAIESSGTGLMTLSEIYQWITDHFEYYRNRPSDGWKNSIRHNLSLSKSFVRIPRGIDDPGKGSYWTVDPSCPVHQPGSRPVRRRKRRSAPLLAVAPYVPEIDVGSISVPDGFQGLQDLTKMTRTYLPCDSSTSNANQETIASCSTCLLEASMEASGITCRGTIMDSSPLPNREDVNYVIPVDIDFSSLENEATDQWNHEQVDQNWRDFDWLDFL